MRLECGAPHHRAQVLIQHSVCCIYYGYHNPLVVEIGCLKGVIVYIHIQRVIFQFDVALWYCIV